MRIITVTNQKGGVGKTTLSCHLAMAGNEACKKVLVVDLDTQGNAGAILSQDVTINTKEGGSEQLFADGDITYTQTESGIKLLHGHPWLESLDTQDTLQKALAIRSKIRALPFDIVIFDTPPSIGPRQVAPLLWSDIALVPVEPASLSMSGLASVLQTIDKARAANPALKTKIAINRYLKSSAKQKEMVASLREHRVLKSQVVVEFTNRTAVSDALAEGVPVWKHSKDAKLKKEWFEFAKEILGVK